MSVHGPGFQTACLVSQLVCDLLFDSFISDVSLQSERERHPGDVSQKCSIGAGSRTQGRGQGETSSSEILFFSFLLMKKQTFLRNLQIQEKFNWWWESTQKVRNWNFLHLKRRHLDVSYTLNSSVSHGLGFVGVGSGVCSDQSGPESWFRPGHWDSMGQTPVWTPPAGDSVSLFIWNTSVLQLQIIFTLKYKCQDHGRWTWCVSLLSLDHYSRMSDVQTLAMLCSVFRTQAPPPDCYSLYGHQPSRSAMFPPQHSRYVSLTSVSSVRF